MFNRLTNFLKDTFQDRFKRYLIISLIVLGIMIGFTSQGTSSPAEGFEVHFFYLPGCSHCQEQEPFNEKLKSEYLSINFTAHDTTKTQEHALLQQMLSQLGIEYEPDVPITIISISENQTLVDGWVSGGWESENTTGRAIRDALQQCLAGDCPSSTGEEPRHTIRFFKWEIDPSAFSLPTLAVILGLVDGFNPCAMWVLVYLISLVATLRDRRSIWLIVGSFF